MNFVDNFVSFVTSIGLAKFVRYFYFFIVFEFLRFFVLELFVLLLWQFTHRFRKDRWTKAHHELWTRMPLVSIIIPGKNEGKHIYKLVQSLAAQTYQNYEVIVIDDGSDDDTERICRNLQQQGFIDLFIRNDVRGGKASAANLAWRFSKGEFVVHLDADCSYEPSAIENIVKVFYFDPLVGGVGGNVQVRNYKDSLAATFQAIEYFDSISIGRISSSELGIYRVISGAFGAFKKEALDKIGGWDIGPGLDGDITVKLRKIGYKVKYEPTAICKTSAPETFRKLAKQRLRWDKSLVRFRLRKHIDVLLPSRNFSLSNFISFAENIVYNLVLNFKWYFYIIDIIFNFTSLLPFILLTNLCLYSANYLVKFILFSMFRLSQKEPIAYFLPYLPGMVIYFGYFLRFTRTIAYIQELFFKASYNDPWNPHKSSKFAKQMRL
jgi:cellulose synthase/poly-beta-1,6-N-acetylglucosamine synthase-like glycosyltransferase